MNRGLDGGVLAFSAMLLVLTGAKNVAADTLADSVRDFSGTQGANGWAYGYWDESMDADGRYDPSRDFRPFSNFGSDPINGLSAHTEFTTGDLWYLEDGRYYTSLWAAGGHPHGDLFLGSYARADHWVVRRWVSTVNGPIEISGHAGKVMPWGENWGGSVTFRVVADGELVHEAEHEDGGQPYTTVATVEAGSLVDFLIGPGSSIGVSQFTAVISGPDGASDPVSVSHLQMIRPRE